MTRIGINPARDRVTAYHPARVTVAVLTYMPHMQGYFQNRFDVIKLCFSSLIANTEIPHDLMVFDNGSCSEVRKYLEDLQHQGHIRYLILSSENIGKLGALRVIAGAAPGDLIAYADDDTFFYPGWLREHVSIFDHFDRVGMVSGSPERTLFDHGISSNLRFAQESEDVELNYGKTIPDQWELDWAVALGYDPDEFSKKARELDDITLEQNGFRAYATACHNQFVSPKRVLQEALADKWTGRLMGGLREFDEAIDEAGFLRLTTIDRTTRLIGNVLSVGIVSEAKAVGVERSFKINTATVKSRNALTRSLLRIRPFRWLMQGIYNRLFWLLISQSGGWVEPVGGDRDSA